jgi:hypothetical protein
MSLSDDTKVLIQAMFSSLWTSMYPIFIHKVAFALAVNYFRIQQINLLSRLKQWIKLNRRNRGKIVNITHSKETNAASVNPKMFLDRNAVQRARERERESLEREEDERRKCAGVEFLSLAAAFGLQ